MPQWRASSRRSRPNEQRAKRIGRETRQEPTCSIHRTLLQREASSLGDWISEPYGVRDQGWISLGGCHPNRVQANPLPHRAGSPIPSSHLLPPLRRGFFFRRLRVILITEREKIFAKWSQAL